MMRWITQEVQDVLAIKDCFNALNRIDTKLKDLREKASDDRKLLQAQQNDKTTLRGLWNKIISKELTNEQLEVMIKETDSYTTEWTHLKEYLVVYIWLVVVPRFCTYRS